MAGWRDIKRRARFDLHREFQVPALYRAPGSLLWAKCRVRVHSKTKQLGGVEGVNYIYADREEFLPKIVFLASEVIPERGGIVSVEFDEAFRIDHTDPRDNITIEADAYRMEMADMKDFPVPGKCDPSLMCEPTGFQPKAQYGVWKGTFAAGKISFGDQSVAQFNAPYNSFTWANGDFIPYQTNEAYDFTIDISGVSAIGDNWLSLTFGSYANTLPVTNEVGVVTHKRFSGTVFASTTPIEMLLNMRGPFSIDDIKISIAPRVHRTEERLVVGQFNTTYLLQTLTRSYPEQVNGLVTFDLSNGVKTTEIIGDGCDQKTWFNLSKIAADPKALYDVQLRVNVTSQIVENNIEFDLGGDKTTRDLPAAAGTAVDITVKWTALMNDDKALGLKTKGPLQLNSASIEIIPR